MTIIKKARAMLQLVRPELPISAGVCVVVGQVIGLGKFPPVGSLVLGFLLGLFLSSSAMVFNDYFDLEVDKINAPYRPLAAGLLSKGEAVAFGLVTALIALGIAWVIQPLAFGLSLVTWVLGFLYNWKLKAAGLWGNLIVCTNVGMTFIMGGVSVGQAANPLVWIFGLIAFTFDLAEEIAGDAMDMAGDAERESRSLAIVYGKRAALRVSALLFGGVIVLTVLPVVLGERGLGYLIPIAVMDGLIGVFTYRMVKSTTPADGRGWMRKMYLSATLGLVAFILARFI